MTRGLILYLTCEPKSSFSSTAVGCNDEYCEEYDRAAVVEAVQDSDIVVVCLGTGYNSN